MNCGRTIPQTNSTWQVADINNYIMMNGMGLTVIQWITWPFLLGDTIYFSADVGTSTGHRIVGARYLKSLHMAVADIEQWHSSDGAGYVGWKSSSEIRCTSPQMMEALATNCGRTTPPIIRHGEWLTSTAVQEAATLVTGSRVLHWRYDLFLSRRWKYGQ